jgi:HD superfamily phosphohydrolase
MNYGILFYLLQAVHDLYELFHTRNNLFRRAYYHQVSTAVEYMYVYNYVKLGISINFSYRCQTTNSTIRAQKKSLLKKKVPFTM